MEPNKTTSAHNPLEPYEEIDTSTGVKKMVKNIKEGLKKLAQPRKFEFKEIPDAHQAYLLSKYGKANDKEDRLYEYMSCIAEMLKYKHSIREYALVHEIPEDLVEYKESILQFFISKGYTAVELSTVVEGLARPYLFIAFDNFHKTKESLIGNEEKIIR